MLNEFTKVSAIFILALVVGCFTILLPKDVCPMLTASVKQTGLIPEALHYYHARPERPSHLHPEALHPALREKGRTMAQRTIENKARPRPIPGIRPLMGGGGHMVPSQSKCSGNIGIIILLYTVGTVIWFVYTIRKALFKESGDKDCKAAKIKDLLLDPEYRKYVFAEEYLERDMFTRQERENSKQRRQESGTQQDTKFDKKSSLNKWKLWIVDLFSDSVSPVDQAVSCWFWNLIKDLLRGYFAQTFDQVSHLDKNFWEGMFKIEDLKEPLKSGTSEKVFEEDFINLQGFFGKYSLSSVIYEDELSELQNNLYNVNKYSSLLKEIRNEFTEEIKAQFLLLKEYIKSHTDLIIKIIAYYKGNTSIISSKINVTQFATINRASVNKREVNNYKLKNISKLLFGSPAQVITLFFATQSIFASAATMQSINSSGVTINSSTTLLDQEILTTLRKAHDDALILKNKLNFISREAQDLINKLDQKVLIGISNVNNRGAFRRPNSNDAKINLLQTVINVQDELTKLKEQQNHSSRNFNIINTVASDLQSVKKQFDDEGRGFLQKHKQHDILFTKFGIQLKDVQKIIQDDKQEHIKRNLPNECIKAIKNRDYKTATEKFQLINDDSKMNLIIEEVYNNKAVNFDLILGFGGSVQDIRTKYLVYKALNYEMESNDHKDPFKMIKLSESLEEEIINHLISLSKMGRDADQLNYLFGLREETKSLALKYEMENNEHKESFKMIKLIESLEKAIINYLNSLSGIKRETVSIISYLRNSIKSIAKEKLIESMLNNRYASNIELANKIYNFSNELFKELIAEVVNDIYGRIDTKKILSFIIYNSTYIEQIISGSTAVFDKMKGNHDLKGDVVFELAYSIKEIMKMNTYSNIESHKKSDFERLKSMLPKSVKNVVFALKICIKNYFFKEYLYAANFAKYDNDRRRVFSWIPGTRDDEDQDRWKLEFDGNFYHIKNIKYNEQLYTASDYFNYDKDRSRVFTWIPGGDIFQSIWKFEPNGDNCYIKNALFNEYLYADHDSFKFDRDRRRVFTRISGEKFIESKWEIENCE